MYTRVTGPNFTHCLKKEVITVGRRSHLPIDICLGDSDCISRKHLELHTINGSLYLRILGRNGIFIDEEFQMFGNDLIPITNCCRLRFPSTTITLIVEPLDSSASARHPKKRTIWRYSAEISGITDYNSEITEYPEEKRQKLTPAAAKEEDAKASETTSLISESAAKINNGSSEAPLSKSESCTPPSEVFHLTNQSTNTPPVATKTSTSSSSCDQLDQSTSQRFPNLAAAYAQVQQKSCPTFVMDSTNASRRPEGSAPQSPAQNGSPYTPAPPSTTTSNDELNQEGSGDTGDQSGGSNEKPPYSYAQLIVQAIVSDPRRRMTLSDIYNFIATKYPFYKLSQKGWQNSIRHNLSLNRYFIRIPRGPEEPGKGAFWTLDPESEDHQVLKAYQKRRQRSYVVPAYMSPDGTLSTTASHDDRDETTSAHSMGPFTPAALHLASNDGISHCKNSSTVPSSASSSVNSLGLFVRDDNHHPLSRTPILPNQYIPPPPPPPPHSHPLNRVNPASNLASIPDAQLFSLLRTNGFLRLPDSTAHFLMPPVTTTTTTRMTPTNTTASASQLMPNLTASLLRSRSGSLSRRASEPDLQKCGVSVPRSSGNPGGEIRAAMAAAATLAVSAAGGAPGGIDGSRLLSQLDPTATEQVFRALRENFIREQQQQQQQQQHQPPTMINADSNNGCTNPPNKAMFLAQAGSTSSPETEHYRSPPRHVAGAFKSGFEDDTEDDESTISVHEGSVGHGSHQTTNPTAPIVSSEPQEVKAALAMTQS